MSQTANRMVPWLVALAMTVCVNPLQAATSSDALDAALAGAQRSADHRARDAFRHPKETLLFFGLEPTMHVVEMLPGAEGWYSEILAPVLRDHGLLVAVTPPADSAVDYLRAQFTKFKAKLGAEPTVYDKVEQRFLTKDKIDLGAPGSADMVVTFRATHNWIRGGQLERVYKAIFDVLKPGGILGIEQHRAVAGADPAIEAEHGYVPEAYLIQYLQSLGFKLEAKSEINANPKDTKDYPKGVWTLPPTYVLGDVDRAKYAAIGESDRMTLKFRKPSL